MGLFGGKKETEDANAGMRWDGRQWVPDEDQEPTLPPLPPKPTPITLAEVPTVAASASSLSGAGLPVPPRPASRFSGAPKPRYVDPFAAAGLEALAETAATPAISFGALPMDMPGAGGSAMPFKPMMPGGAKPFVPGPAKPFVPGPAPPADGSGPAPPADGSGPISGSADTPAKTSADANESTVECERLRAQVAELTAALADRSSADDQEDQDVPEGASGPQAVRTLRRKLAKASKSLQTATARSRTLEQELAARPRGGSTSAALSALPTPTQTPMPALAATGAVGGAPLADAALQQEAARWRGIIEKLATKVAKMVAPSLLSPLVKTSASMHNLLLSAPEQMTHSHNNKTCRALYRRCCLKSHRIKTI